MVSTYISVTLGVVDNSAWSRRLRRRIHPLLCAMERELEYKPHGVLGRLFNLLLAVLVLEYAYAWLQARTTRVRHRRQTQGDLSAPVPPARVPSGYPIGKEPNA